jgi:ADP-ribosylglycohydrolase
VGDALGAAVEFQPRGTFESVTGMRGGGPFGLQPGYWTDDTSLALCLAESLIECEGFDPKDQMRRYLRWYRDGYLSSTGHCFDIGGTTASALHAFEGTGDPYCGPTEHSASGNGSLMRLAPVPLFYVADPERAVTLAGDSSRTTHGSQACVDSCRYYGGLLVGAATGVPKEALSAPWYLPPRVVMDPQDMHPGVAEVASGSFLEKDEAEIRGSGYVIAAMEAALWCLATTDTFAEGALRAVNLGDDTDTTAAIYGQLAGAIYGLSGIPADWVEQLAQSDMILEYADRLAAVARHVAGEPAG